MTVTDDNVKVGDKVVWNEIGKRYIDIHESKPTKEVYKRVTHGIVVDVKPSKGYISINIIDYKGKVLYEDWYVYKHHLDLYEG